MLQDISPLDMKRFIVKTLDKGCRTKVTFFLISEDVGIKTVFASILVARLSASFTGHQINLQDENSKH